MLMISLLLMTIEDATDRMFMENLYISHERLMHKRAMQILHNIHDADDAVNNTCIKLIRKIDYLRTLESQTLRAYVFMAISNEARDLIRKRTRDHQNAFLSDHDVMDNIPDKCNIELMLNTEALLVSIAELSQKDSNLLTWKYLYEMSDKDIAKITGLTENSIRVALHRARNRLAKSIKEKITDVDNRF